MWKDENNGLDYIKVRFCTETKQNIKKSDKIGEIFAT